MFGEGEYNIVFEKVSVTDSYLGLKKDVRNCQESVHDYQHCVTKIYVQRLKEKCQCLPLSMSMDDKVVLYAYFYIYF